MKMNRWKVVLIASLALVSLSCQQATKEEGDALTDTLARSGIDGDWFYCGGFNQTSYDFAFDSWRDTRLHISSQDKTLAYYWMTEGTTRADWTTDYIHEGLSIQSLEDRFLVSVVTQPPVDAENPDNIQKGDRSENYYRLVGDELHWWWMKPGVIDEPFDWNQYVIYRRTRPTAE